MRRSALWQRRVLPFLVVSSLYVAAFIVTMYGLFPLQTTYTPQITEYTSLLFLPHGVRILAAWLLGWRSIILIAPSALYTHWLIMGWAGFSVLGIIGALCGVTCAAFAFWLVGKISVRFNIKSDTNIHWSHIMLVGIAASVFNSVGMGLAFQHNAATISGYFIGDITGLLACLLILMLGFKLLRALKDR